METLNIEKDQKIIEIDLPTLEATGNLSDFKGKLPASRPLEHYKLIQGVEKIFNKFSDAQFELETIKCDVKNIHIHKKKDDPNDKIYSLDDHFIQRLITTARLKASDDPDDLTMAIAIAYSEKGISIAFGSNVYACNNMQVFGENILHTFSAAGYKNKVSWEKATNVLRDWANQFQTKREQEFGIIEQLRSTTVERDSVIKLYGHLFQQAILEKPSSPQYILNQTQCAGFVRASMDERYQVPISQDMKAWDLLQMGTDIIKPENGDMTIVTETSRRFSNLIYDKYVVA